MGIKKILERHENIKAEKAENEDENIEEQLMNAENQQSGMGLTSQERADANTKSQDFAKAMAKEMKRNIF